MASKFATSNSTSSSGTSSWIGAWSGATQLLEENFVRDFESTSPEAKLQAIRSIRNFITANSINKRVIVHNERIYKRIMSLTCAFSPSCTFNYSNSFKRDCLCMYSSLLRDNIGFAEEICKQQSFLTDLLDSVNPGCEDMDPSLREIILLFFKTLFEADNLDQELGSLPGFKKSTALELFTPARMSQLIGLTSALLDAQRRGDTTAACGLLNAAKVLALLASDATAAASGGREVTEQLLRLAHRGAMATACPRHAPLIRQERSLILPYDVARLAPCPDATLHAVARFSLKILFFVIYHVLPAFQTFKTIVGESDAHCLISIYPHLSLPYSRSCCHLAASQGDIIPTSPGACVYHRRLRRCETQSDPFPVYAPNGDPDDLDNCESDDSSTSSTSNDEARVGMDTLGLYSPDGAFGLSGTADRTMCLMVGLLRGVLFWRCCEAARAARKRPGEEGELELTDDEVALKTTLDITFAAVVQAHDKIIQPLTQNSLPLNGTGVNTWACHVLVLVLKQRASLHRHLLYSQLLTSEFDDTVSCLLKALQPTCDYESYADFLEQLIPFSRLFACLASTLEDVRVRVGELSMIRALIQMFVTHPSLTTSASVASVNLTLTVCQLLHGLSRSVALLHTVFSDVSIIECLVELCTRLTPVAITDPVHAHILLAASSTLVNLQLCQLPDLDASRLKCIDIFRSLMATSVASDRGRIPISLRLNGVWGLANCASVATSNRLANRGETVERMDASNTLPSVIEICEALLLPPTKSESNASADSSNPPRIVFETSGSVLNSDPPLSELEIQCIHKSLLLIRDLFAMKEAQDPELSKRTYTLLAKVLSTEQPPGIKYEAMTIVANLLSNADARSQFWHQKDLLEAMASTIKASADTSILCGAVIVMVNILEQPEPLATTVGGDSPGELFTQILSLLLFEDDGRVGSYGKRASWSRRQRHCSASHRQSPEQRTDSSSSAAATTTTSSEEPSAVPPAESTEVPLLTLLASFTDLLSVFSEPRQAVRDVWDWQYQCGRCGDVDDEDEGDDDEPGAVEATSTADSIQVVRQRLRRRRRRRRQRSGHARHLAIVTKTGALEKRFRLVKSFSSGVAGGLKQLLAAVTKDLEGDDGMTSARSMSDSPPRLVETVEEDCGAASGEGGREEEQEEERRREDD